MSARTPPTKPPSDSRAGLSAKPQVAVALEYDHSKGAAPKVTAKGRGATAERILALASEHDIPIEENGALAEALTQVELDDEIPEELYRAVAAVISYVLTHARKRDLGSGSRP